MPSDSRTEAPWACARGTQFQGADVLDIKALRAPTQGSKRQGLDTNSILYLLFYFDSQGGGEWDISHSPMWQWKIILDPCNYDPWKRFLDIIFAYILVMGYIFERKYIKISISFKEKWTEAPLRRQFCSLREAKMMWNMNVTHINDGTHRPLA